MKRCPRCGTVSGDTDLACGVCGAGIADIPSESLEEASATHNLGVGSRAWGHGRRFHSVRTVRQSLRYLCNPFWDAVTDSCFVRFTSTDERGIWKRRTSLSLTSSRAVL